jgi:hypothetical protein
MSQPDDTFCGTPQWRRRAQQSKSLWQRFKERHPKLAAPVVFAGATAGTLLVESARGPLKSYVQETVADWASHIAVVGPTVAKYVSEPAGTAATAVAIGAVAGGVTLWKNWQRRRPGEPEPEDPAAKIERIDETSTEAREQATRANTRLSVVNNRLGTSRRRTRTSNNVWPGSSR